MARPLQWTSRAGSRRELPDGRRGPRRCAGLAPASEGLDDDHVSAARPPVPLRSTCGRPWRRRHSYTDKQPGPLGGSRSSPRMVSLLKLFVLLCLRYVGLTKRRCKEGMCPGPDNCIAFNREDVAYWQADWGAFTPPGGRSEHLSASHQGDHYCRTIT